MRKTLGAIVLVVTLAVGASARAACECPKTSLDERIAGAAVIFAGKPLMFAQIPSGSSPFHSEQSIETPGPVQYDVITLFAVDTVWKGEPTHRIKVRHERGDCSADFKPDVSVIVFAEADASGVLWTRLCSGNAASDETEYEALKQGLTDRLRYN